MMSNIKDEQGVNDCYFNYQGKCTSPKVDRAGKVGIGGHVFSSKLNCVYSQRGTQLCSAYIKEPL
jgi:hypothetical protein